MRRSTRAEGYERLAAELPNIVLDHKPLQYPWKAQCGCEEAMEGYWGWKYDARHRVSDVTCSQIARVPKDCRSQLRL